MYAQQTNTILHTYTIKYIKYIKTGALEKLTSVSVFSKQWLLRVTLGEFRIEVKLSGTAY